MWDYDYPYGPGRRRQRVGQTMARYGISDPEIHPAFIGDPNIHAPYYFAPRILPAPAPELFRFVTWGSNGFVPAPVGWVSKDGWVSSGPELCQAAGELRVHYPNAILYLVSSTRGWLSQSGATGDQWYSFLACNQYDDFGHFYHYA